MIRGCYKPMAALGLSALMMSFSQIAATEGSGGGTLQRVIVQANRESVLTGTASGEGRYRFSTGHIERYGGADGSLDGVLRLVPGLQFGESALEADSLQDLRPESISISGGRFYENQFMLDGLSISNRIDPASTSATSINDVPGHEQSQFIDADLIGEVRVFDSNVPAEYGRFTGGVVDIDTRRAGIRPEGSVYYNTTRSDWVSYQTFTRDWDPDSDLPPPSTPDSPGFRRDRAGVNYSTPVGEQSGVMFGASRSFSRTPVATLGRTRSQQQENTNLLGKFTRPLGERGLLDLGATYAPYRSELFLPDVRDSDITVTGGGYGVTAGMDFIGDRMEHEWKFGATYSENSRSASNGYFNWRNTPSRSWGREADVGTSREGGYGDLDTYQAAFSAAWRGTTGRSMLGPVGTRHRFGVDTSHQRYRFQRDEDLYIHDTAVTNTEVQCRGITADCVQREQYFANRQVHEADDVEVVVNETAAFSETTIDYRRASVALGLRYDYDDFLRNHDVAYRTRGTLDLFGDGRTVLRAGLNRYYGAPLLTYKLREARKPHYRELRGTTQNIVQDWEEDSGQGRYRYVFEDLDTPYSDERMVGLEQALLGGRFRAQLIQRDNRNEFSRTTTETQPDGYRYYLMNNDGSTRYRAASVGWFAEYGRTAVSLSASYSETETSNADYDDPLDPNSSSTYVYLDNRRVRYGRLDSLREDFARPLVANLNISRQLGHRFTAGVNLRYRSSHDVISRTGATRPGEPIELDSGEIIREELDVYETRDRPSTFITDLSLAYRQAMWRGHVLLLEAEINNVFNTRTHTVLAGESGVEIGRFLWLGARYQF